LIVLFKIRLDLISLVCVEKLFKTNETLILCYLALHLFFLLKVCTFFMKERMIWDNCVSSFSISFSTTCDLYIYNQRRGY
jgi:hypothetical protein